jgi:eukaryotic-like serine/threonine-protein kinase
MRDDPSRRANLPTRIGPYRVLGRLGEGSTSEVFHARDDFRNRDVAIKCMRPPEGLGTASGSAQEHFYERFFAAEAALVGKLVHPNVVQIYDAVADARQPHLVMEYVPGTTLRAFCRPDALMSLEQIVEIGFKCAMALGYVARLGLIHRDVKPANLLALTDRHDRILDVKISDFGSVLQLDAERTQIHRVGSLAYMSPEQLDGAALDARADMYSLAAVLYHLICGRPPFEGPTQAALMHQVFNEAARPLTQLRDGVPESLDRLVRRALAKSAADRPADWDAFAQDLAGVISRREVPRGRVQGVLDSERFNLLRGLEFFERFGDVELWEVVHRAKWQRFPFGHALYKQGQEGRDFHIIAAGAR